MSTELVGSMASMLKSVLKSLLLPSPLVVSPETRVGDVVWQMCDRHSACVVLDQGRVVGLLTQQDVVRLSTAPDANWQQLAVRQVMSQPAVTLCQTMFVDIASTLQFLQQRQIHHLPIVDQSDAFVGLVTYDQLCEHLLSCSTADCSTAEASAVHDRPFSPTPRSSTPRSSIPQAPIPQSLDMALSLTEAVRELRERDQCYRHLYEQAAIGCVNATLEGEFIGVNQFFAQMLGYSRQELQTKTVLDVTHPDDQELLMPAMQRLLSGECSYFVQEKRYVKKNGRDLLAMVCVSLIRDELGTPKYTFALVRDISERKRAELSLQNLIAGAAATTGKHFFPAVVKYIAQALNVSHVLLSELRGTHLHALAFWSEGQLSPLFSFPLSGSVCEQVCLKGSLYLEDCLQAAFPQSMLIEQGITTYLGIALYDAEGNPLGNLCIFDRYPLDNPDQAEQLLRVFAARAGAELERQQVTRSLERLNQDLEKKVEERTATLRQMNEALLHATKLKDEFLANMSHELRTPLNAILGMTEGLKEMVFGPLNERQFQALQLVENSATRLLGLFDNILDVAKIEAGDMTLNLEPVVVKSLCLSSMAFVKHQAEKKRIRLCTVIAPDLPCLSLDGHRIRQVLINLLDNAVKFTPEGGGITLEVGLQFPKSGYRGEYQSGQPEYLCIAVTDTGVGIAPKDCRELFKPFRQLDSSVNRRYQGIGLGLVLVKHIVELHGGQVWFSSELGQGSQFVCELPYRVISAQDEPKAIFPDPQAIALPVAPQAHLVLFIEDKAAYIATLLPYLRSQGFCVAVARDSQTAIAHAHDQKPSLILLDVQMLEMDGMELMRHLRQEPDLSKIPIIVLTSLATESEHERYLVAGASHCLTKPIQLRRLSSLMQQLLEPDSVPLNEGSSHTL